MFTQANQKHAVYDTLFIMQQESCNPTVNYPCVNNTQTLLTHSGKEEQLASWKNKHSMLISIVQLLMSNSVVYDFASGCTKL